MRRQPRSLTCVELLLCWYLTTCSHVSPTGASWRTGSSLNGMFDMSAIKVRVQHEDTSTGTPRKRSAIGRVGIGGDARSQ